MSKKKKDIKKTYLGMRKYTSLELVEVPEDDQDVDSYVEIVDGPKLCKSAGETYVITNLRTHERLADRTLEQVEIFKKMCSTAERKNFLFEKSSSRKPYWTITDRKSGMSWTDCSERECKKFIKLHKASDLEHYDLHLTEGVTAHSVDAPKKRTRVTGQVKDHRKDSAFGECVSDINESETRDITILPSLSPELDTVRVYFDCQSFIDIDLFIPFSATKMVRLAQKNPFNQSISMEYEKYRTEMSFSSFGKMQITREERCWGKNAKYSYPVLSFEYSVAKWYNFCNGINSGIAPSAEYLLMPCVEAMRAFGIERFSTVSFNRIAQIFFERAEIRRFDLSLNFRCPALYKPSDYVNLVGHCHINRQDGKIQDDGSYAWGTGKSPYRIICYDKEKEQKNYFKEKDGRPRVIYYEDEHGNTFEHQNQEKSLKEKVFDPNEEKKNFYEKNKHLFEGIFRYEVQFRAKFMSERNLMTQGVENINNVLKMGEVYWRDILNRIDEQLGRENFNTKEQTDALAKVMDRLTDMKSSNAISRTVYNNMTAFIMQCNYSGWQVVRDEMGKDLFSRKYRWVKQNLDYDLKIVAQTADMPIMRDMLTIYLSKQANIMRDFRLTPAPVYSPAI